MLSSSDISSASPSVFAASDLGPKTAISCGFGRDSDNRAVNLLANVQVVFVPGKFHIGDQIAIGRLQFIGMSVGMDAR